MYTLITNIVNHLRSFLIDPNDDRKSNEWIEEGFPVIVGSEYPIVGVWFTNNQREELGLVASGRYKDVLSLTIGIFFDKGGPDEEQNEGSYMVQGEEKQGYAAVQKLYEVIRDRLETNDSLFNGWGWRRPIPQGIRPYSEEESIAYLCDWQVWRWNT